MRKLFVVTIIGLGWISGGVPASHAYPVDAGTPRLEAREKLYHYLFSNREGRRSAEVVRELLARYRWKKGLNGESPVLTVQNAPFPRLLLALTLKDPEIYGSLYLSAYRGLTENPSYEQLFDAFLGLRVSGALPESIRKEASKLTLGMARKAQRGASPACRLDESDRLFKVGKVKQLKLALGLTGNCETRKLIFNLVKRNLREVKQGLASLRVYREEKGIDPCSVPSLAAHEFSTPCGVIAEVNRDYGHLFRDGLAAKLGEMATVMPQMFAKKFGGGDHAIWSSLGSVIDPVEDQAIRGDGQIVQLRSFARGMRVDLEAAKVLMTSSLRSDRALAGGLFYSVINRMIYFLGGDLVKVDAEGAIVTLDNSDYTLDVNGQRVRVPEPVALDGRGLPLPVYRKEVDANGRIITEELYVKPLVFQTESVGGMGVNQTSDSLTMSAWDPVTYDPDAADPALRTPFRLIPTRLRLSASGLPYLMDPIDDLVQRNTDLAEIAMAVSEFMVETKPAGSFGKFFGPSESLAEDLVRMDRSMLIPNEGRMLPVAILGILAQNALHPTLGHVKKLADVPLLAFQDEANFDSVGTRDISVSGVAAVLSACHDLRETLRDDPIFKEPLLASLKAEAGALEGVLQLGVQIYAGGTQDPDTGRFVDRLYPLQNSPKGGGSLDTQIDALYTLLKAYNQARAIPTRVRVGPGLAYLVTALEQTDVRKLTSDQLFRLTQLWKITQVYFRKDWADRPWDHWEAVFKTVEREFDRRI